MEKSFIILLYYKYLPLINPDSVCDAQKQFCKEHNLKGRIIIATEGINGTLEGADSDIRKYVEWMESQEIFRGIHYKYSVGTGEAFPKLSVKTRNEIVAYR